MPIFLDRHDLSGLTAADIAEAHRKDLEVQGRYGVRFLTYWFDERRGTGFCLIDEGGRKVKHTGDGIMASFPDAAAVRCACAIQRAFEAFNLASAEPLRVRIGIHVGEPVEDSRDLFGAAVQMAARLYRIADPDTIVVSEAVRALLPERIEAADLGQRRLKGFAEPVALYAIPWC